jgi:multisubunit Na+/H+ antiporter MnhG subunit
LSARDYVIYALVAAAVAAECVSVVGLVAMRNPLDRLHYAAAATTVGPAFVAAAVSVREGVVSSQGLNSILVAALLALGGAALSGASGRLIRLHERGTLESTPAERERGSR